MTCALYRPRPMTFGEAKELVGGKEALVYGRPGESAAAIASGQRQWDKAHAEPAGPAGKVFFCGEDMEEVTICRDPGCDYESSILCDWPMGDGRTCDLPLCQDHARNVGEDRDFCLVHFAMWVGATRTERLASWPHANRRPVRR